MYRASPGARIRHRDVYPPSCPLSCPAPASPHLQTNLGRQLKEMLQIPDQSKIGFMAHSDAKRDDRRAKERYTV